MLDSTPKQAQKLSGKAAGPYSIRAVFETGYRQIAVLTPRDGIRYGYELDANDRPARAAWTAALERERQGIQSEAYRRGLAIAAEANSERGAVSLPLLAFQACCALGLASGVAAVVAWAQGVLGGVL